MAYVDVRKIAQRGGFAVQTLNKWRVTGKGPPFSKFGKAVRYSTEKFDKWCEEHEQRSTSETSRATKSVVRGHDA